MDDNLDFDEYFDLVLYHSTPGGGPVELGPSARWQTWWRIAARRLAADEPELAAALQQGFVLATPELAALGLTPQRVRTRVRSGSWSAPQRGAVAVVDPRADHGIDVDDWSIGRRRHALGCAAAALMNPGFTVCGRSGAIVHGLPTLSVPAAPLLSTPPALHTRRRGAANIEPSERTDWYGVPVTTVARTILDVARLDRRDGLVVADAALRERLTDPAALEQSVGRASGWPGVRAAHEIVTLADGRSESPLESATRLALYDSGFPRPEPQYEIAVPGRRVPYRVDLCWPDLRLVLECDGRVKYRKDAGWQEKRRETALRRAGFRVERVVWADVLHDWPTTEAYLRTVFSQVVPRRLLQ